MIPIPIKYGVKGNVLNFSYYFICLLVIGVSFYIFSSFNPAYFNSDQAIQALMLKDFSWPADSYFWGQNRLGSLLPLVSLPFYWIFHLHPIWLLTIINHLMLLFSWFLISKNFNTSFAKILLLIAIFLPHHTYHFILLVAHPYPQQLFCLAISTHFFNSIFHILKSHQRLKTNGYLKLFCAHLFAILACWVSELSAVYFVFVAFYILYDKEIRDVLFLKHFKPTKQGFKIISFSFISILLGLFWILDLKHNMPSDPEYDKAFITSKEQIINQFHFFSEQFWDIILLRNHQSVFECLYYYAVFILTGYIGIITKKSNPILKALAQTLIVASILLFFSSWNYRSKFDPKYFTLLYVYIFVYIGIAMNNFGSIFRYIVFTILGTFTIISSLDIAIKKHKNLSIFKEYEKANTIEKGTLVANYWDAYKIAAIANTELQAICKDSWIRRNEHKKSKWINNKNYYFLKKEINYFNPKGDSLEFLNMYFIKSNKVFYLNQDTILEYYRLTNNNK